MSGRLMPLLLALLLLVGCSAGGRANVPGPGDSSSGTGQNPTVPGGAAAPGQATPGQPVELTLYTMLGTRREPIDAAIDAYTKKHPNVKIRIKEVQPQELWTSNGTANGAAVAGADLLLTQETIAAGMERQGLLRDLSAVRLPPLNELAAPLFDELGRLEGKRFGLPYVLTPGVMLLNPGVFATAGLPMPPVDWTVQEFEQTVLALKQAGATFNMPARFLLDPMVRAYGGLLYDSAREEWLLDTPEAKQGISLVGRLAQQGTVSNMTANVFVFGSGPSGPAITAMPSSTTMNAPGTITMPYPKGPAGRSVSVGAQVGVVLGDSAHPEAATDFLKALISDPEMQRALASGGIRPVIDDAKALAAWQEAVGDHAAQVTELSLEGGFGGGQPNPQELVTGLDPYFKGTAALDDLIPNLLRQLQ